VRPYKVELEELLGFADQLQAFDARADDLAAQVDRQVGQLQGSWFGEGAEAHQARHDEWMAAAAQMRQALGELRDAARRAHRNYTEAIAANTEMWP
jgi:WXG100 family type VII secretion target